MALRTKRNRRPFQVYLDETEAHWLERAAEVTGRTKSDLVREAVRRVATEHIPVHEDPLWKLMDLLSEEEANSMPRDFAEKHDEYLVRWQMEDDGKLPKLDYRKHATRGEAAESADS